MSSRGGRSHAHEEAIRRFGEIPVVEAAHEMRIIPHPCDLDGAVPGDPQHCVLAKACERMGFEEPLFFRSIAYMRIPDERGNPRLERFVLSILTRRAVAEFDRTGLMPLGGFVLSPPGESHTLEYQRLKAKARREHLASTGQQRSRRTPHGPRTDVRTMEGVRWGTTVPHTTTRRED